MFKTILRTLSALSIVTITASAGFAQANQPAVGSPEFCALLWNEDNAACQVTTEIWSESLSEQTPIKDAADTEGEDNQFVRFGPNGFNDAEGNLIIGRSSKRGKLNLKADVTQDDDTIVNEIIGGVLFYRNFHLDSLSYNYYAGIKSGTDLGRPLSEDIVEAGWTDDWNGKIRTVWKGNSSYHLETDFALTITFNGGTGKVGDIYALVRRQGQAHYLIDGEFDSKGVITGKVTYGLFNASDSLNPYTNIGRIDGTLSGLIGDKGAVGVFISDKDDRNNGLNGFSGGFVVSGFSEGKSVLLRACSLDPFDVQCSDTEFDSRKTARIEYCITGDNALGSSKDCAGAIGATRLEVSCIINPFQTVCASDADYAAQYITARADRVAFCEQSTNSESDVCKGDTIVAGVCGVNPFGAVCAGDYDEEVNDWLITCEAGTVAADNSRCVQANPINEACAENPFGANCGFDTFDETRETFTGYCLGESPNILCTNDIRDEVLKRPNAATWVNSFKTEENPEGLGILPNADTYDYDKPFLKKIESASQPDSGIEIYINPGDDASWSGTTYKTLNLSTAEFNDTPLGGDAKDGVASFRGHATGQSTNYRYAGIFSTTDLGAPVTDEEGTASWVGSFYWVHDWGRQSSKDFVLEVNFDTQSIEAFVGRYYYLKGDYDANGVISGTVINDDFIDNSRYKPAYGEGGYIHPLTGLIGKEGAVGAFSYGAFVARPADLVVNPYTGKTAETFLNGLNGLCEGNPFHEFCYLSAERKARIAHCSMGDNAINTDDNALDWDCMTDVESDSCIRHPFDEKCKPTATSHYKIARENRSAFCNETANVAHLFCIGAEQNALCLYNPFHTICSNAIYDNVRKAVCKADSSHTGCTNAHDTSSDVTAITWLAGLYKDDGVVPQTKPDTIRGRHQFLQGTANGLDNGDVEIRTTYGYDGLQFGSLNLNTATFDGLELGLGKDRQGREDAADDGVAFFRGYNYASYAGIFSGTDLGEPLDSPTTATWYGQFQNVWGLKTDFTLDVTFDGTVGTVEAFVYNGFANHYLLSGKFDDNGVISGTVAYGYFPNYNQTISNIEFNASLTGLIGAEGAVGVFTGGILTGGFVASSKSAADAFDPNVKFSDWVRSFGNTPVLPTYIQWNATQQALFLQGTETGLDTNYISNAVPQTLTLADGDLGGEAADGAVYAFLDRRYHIAGILSGTNLGAALPTIPAGANGAITATWDGKLGLIANQVEIPKRDIKLTVDFSNTNIAIADTKTDDNKHFVNFNGLGWDGNGVITGKITYDATPTLQTDGNYAASDGSEGIVSGLIGRDGAVGAFRSTHVDNPTATHTSYAGGFVAAPPAITYLNWLNGHGGGIAPAAVPNTSPRKNQFLHGGESSLSSVGLSTPLPGSLTLADATFGSGGDVADGVAFFRGTHGGTKYYYAGVLSGTNLGSPLIERVTNATWDGRFQFVNGSGLQNAVDFDLKVTFHGSGLHGRMGSIKAFISDAPVNPFYIDGFFDANGFITGYVAHSATLGSIESPNIAGSSIATLRGIIGQQGAVGAFTTIQREGADAITVPYSGGFVAAPPSE